MIARSAFAIFTGLALHTLGCAGELPPEVAASQQWQPIAGTPGTGFQQSHLVFLSTASGLYCRRDTM